MSRQYFVNASAETEKFIRQLGFIQGAMHEATARSINSVTRKTINRYNQLLKSEFNVRTNYTLNSTKMYPATFMRKSKHGQLRPLRDIRSLVFVRKMKGGKDHYLAAQEEGQIKPDQKSALGTVSIPVASTSRKGGTSKGKVSPKYNLRENGPKHLKIGASGADFGTASDGFTGNQRWAILNKYKNDNPYRWDLKKPFFMRYGGQTDVYAHKGRKIVTIRLLQKKYKKIKKRPLFERAFNMITEDELQSVFNTVAERILR